METPWQGRLYRSGRNKLNFCEKNLWDFFAVFYVLVRMILF